MNNAEFIEFLKNHTKELQSDYQKIIKPTFKGYKNFEVYLSQAHQVLEVNKGDYKFLDLFFIDLVSKYRAKEIRYIHKWLFNGNVDEYSNYYILRGIHYYNLNKKKLLAVDGICDFRDEDIRADYIGTKDYCDHYLKLGECETIEQQKSYLKDVKHKYKEELEIIKCIPFYKEMYNQVNVCTDPDINLILKFKYLINVTKKQLKEIRRSQLAQQLDGDGEDSFIYQPLINPLFELLVNKSVITNRSDSIQKRVSPIDQSRLIILLNRGKVKGGPIKIDLGHIPLTDSFCQFIKNGSRELINCDEVELAFWISNSFKSRRRGNVYESPKTDTVIRYINKRKNSSEGQELFKVIKNQKPDECGYKYILEKII